jgi:hypothetical protein
MIIPCFTALASSLGHAAVIVDSAGARLRRWLIEILPVELF